MRIKETHAYHVFCNWVKWNVCEMFLTHFQNWFGSIHQVFFNGYPILYSMHGKIVPLNSLADIHVLNVETINNKK